MKSSEALKVVLKRNQYISKILQLSKYKSLENEFKLMNSNNTIKSLDI